MKNKRRLIVLLLTLAMVMSQMSFVAFAGTEAAGESDQTVTEQAAVETAFDQTVTENGVDITVKAAEGVFPAGAKLSAKKVDVPDAIDAENALAFDIKILVDGEEVQPKDNAKVEVSFKAAEVKKNETEVYHMDGNKADKLDVATKGTTATVETTGFSTYVLVFKNDEDSATTSVIDYSMGSNQEIALNDIIGNYKPSAHASSSVWDDYEYQFEEWHFESATTASSTSKIEKFTNGTGDYCIRVKSGSTFDDNEPAYINVAYEYKYRYKNGSTWSDWQTDQKDVVKVNITVNTTDGKIVAPTPAQGLVYNESAQSLLATPGSASVGTMQYSMDNGTNWTTDASTIEKTVAGTYTVKWQVILSNKSILKSGSFDVTIAAKLNEMKAVVAASDSAASYKGDTKNFIWAYDGQKHGIRVTATNKDGSEMTTTYTVYYSKTELTAENYTTGKTDPTKVDAADVSLTSEGSPSEYEVFYYVVADGYKPVAGSYTFKIDPAVLVATVVPAHKWVTYGDHIEYKDQKWSQAIDEGTVELKAYVDTTKAKEVSVVRSAISGLDQVAFDIEGYTGDQSTAGVTYPVKLTKDMTSKNYDIHRVEGKLTVMRKGVHFEWISYPDGTEEKPESEPYHGFEWNYDGQIHGVEANIRATDLVGSDKENVYPVYETRKPGEYTNYATDVNRDDDWKAIPYEARVLDLGGTGSSNYAIYHDSSEAFAAAKAAGMTDQAQQVEYVNKNYDGSCDQKYMIKAVNITLTPNPVTTIYGDDAVWAGYTAATLVNDEKQEDVILGEPVYKFINDSQSTTEQVVEYAKGQDVKDSYHVEFVTTNFNTPTGLHAQNYQLAAANGTMTLVKRKIHDFSWVINEAAVKSVEYDGTYKYASVVSVENDFGPGTDTSALKDVTYTNDEQINAGGYTTTLTLKAGKAADNYEIVDESASFQWTITKRPATIYVNSNTITYGQDPAYNGYYIDNKAELTYPNQKTGKYDKIADITPASGYNKYGKPGQYAIGAVVENLNPNYYIADIKQGTLTVNDVVTTLNAKGTKKGSKGILVSWNGVTGAASYDVYMSLCNTKKKNYTPVYVGSTAGTSFKVTKIGKKKLKTRTPYKYYVVAKDAAGNPITRSSLGHFITNNVKGKQVNAKSMSVNTHVVSIGKGGTAGLSASYKKAKKGKKYKLLDGIHAPLSRFVSENPAVATVDANGTVTGVGTGWTRVYVQGVSGMWETVEVNVQ